MNLWEGEAPAELHFRKAWLDLTPSQMVNAVSNFALPTLLSGSPKVFPLHALLGVMGKWTDFLFYHDYAPPNTIDSTAFKPSENSSP